MRDLVETVIDNLLKQEQMQRAAARPKPQHRTPMPKNRLVASSGGTQITTPLSGKRDEKLWASCCKFEAIFLQQMMSAMRKSIPKSGLLGGGFANDVQSSMMDQAIADAGSKQGSLGIAANLYRQLEANRPHPAAASQPAAIQETAAVTDKSAKET